MSQKWEKKKNNNNNNQENKTYQSRPKYSFNHSKHTPKFKVSVYSQAAVVLGRRVNAALADIVKKKTLT